MLVTHSQAAKEGPKLRETPGLVFRIAEGSVQQRRREQIVEGEHFTSSRVHPDERRECKEPSGSDARTAEVVAIGCRGPDAHRKQHATRAECAAQSRKQIRPPSG